MNIGVMVKQVPSGATARIDMATGTLVRDAAASVLNPFDSFALETAVAVKEVLSGRVTAVSMGIPSVKKLLFECLCRGADEAVLMSDRAFAGADTLATARTLAEGVKLLGGFDLIVCGQMAVDGDTAQIGPELAQKLSIRYVTEAAAILGVTGTSVRIRRSPQALSEEVEVQLPALITVCRGINKPRFASIPMMRRAAEKQIRVLEAKDLSLGPELLGRDGSATCVRRSYTPERGGRKAERLLNIGEAAERVARMAAEVTTK